MGNYKVKESGFSADLEDIILRAASWNPQTKADESFITRKKDSKYSSFSV